MYNTASTITYYLRIHLHIHTLTHIHTHTHTHSHTHTYTHTHNSDKTLTNVSKRSILMSESSSSESSDSDSERELSIVHHDPLTKSKGAGLTKKSGGLQKVAKRDPSSEGKLSLSYVLLLRGERGY